jgi:hypothetical protein
MNIKTKILYGVLLSCLVMISAARKGDQASRFQCVDGVVELKSVAILELIQAKSQKLRGLIDPENQTFAWTVEVRSFQGFNSPLQREHFNENYMESDRFPKASFVGKIIEKIDFEQPGVQSVRAKGKLTLHGVEQERIIKSQLEYKAGKYYVTSSFTVPIADHDIAIPKIVHQKIAEEIQVTIGAVLLRQ